MTDQFFQQFANENPYTTSLVFESQMWEAPLPEKTIAQSFNKKTTAVQEFEGFDFDTDGMFATITASTLPNTTRLDGSDDNISFPLPVALETHSSSFQDNL